CSRQAEVGARTLRLLEAALAIPDGPGERRRIPGERGARRLPHQLRAFGQDDRGLELSRMAGAVPELLTEPEGPWPGGKIREGHGDVAVPPNLVHGRLQRGEMPRVEVGVGNGEQPEPLAAEPGGEFHDYVGD